MDRHGRRRHLNKSGVDPVHPLRRKRRDVLHRRHQRSGWVGIVANSDIVDA